MSLVAKASALKKKVRSAAGAPGRALYSVTKGRHDRYKLDKNDKEVGFLKDYNAKARRGVSTSPQDRARFNMIKDR